MADTWFCWSLEEEKKEWWWQPCPSPIPPEDTDASEDPRRDSDLEIFKVVVEHFRHNLEMFWQPYTLFILIQGALITVFTSTTSLGRDRSALAVFGILLSAYWAWIGWTRWRLINHWRKEVMRLDLTVDRHLAFFWVETHAQRRPLLIPAYSALALPPLMAVGWIVLWVRP